jgi:hypothetical protein
MASLSWSAARRSPLGAALITGVLISSVSAVGRADPAPRAVIAFTAPPTAIAPARRPLGGAPSYDVPDYIYVPAAPWTAGVPSIPGMPEMPGQRTWYGWQTLLVFGGSTTVGLIGGFGGGASGSDVVLLAGLSIGGAGFLFGGPIVHWANGHIGRGFGALGLNFGMPLVGAGLGAGVVCVSAGCDADQGVDIFLGVVIGGGLGLIASMVVDVTVLSYEPSTPVASTARAKAPGWTMLPDFHITKEKTTFGVAGVF